MNPNKKTILIIDDCPEDRQVYRRYLLEDKRYTYSLLEEEYGKSGLELCQKIQPDVILLDYMLPDLDGIEFLNELKIQAGHANLPVVMLTGQGNEAIAVAAMKSGSSDYLVKGKTNAETLRLAIHNIIERGELNRQLEESKKRFQTSVENMLDCFGIYTSIRDEFGKILDFCTEFVNAAACVSNQMSKEEQIGKNLCQLLPTHLENGLFEEYCQVVETGIPLEKEVFTYSDLYNKKYLTRVLDIRVTKLGDGFVIAWRDVTERKQAQERLRLLESVVINATDAVLITEATLLDKPGPRILYVNQAFTRMTGYSPQEILGKSPRILQGTKTDKKALTQIRAALIAKEPVQIELINYHKNGSEYWVETSITPVADATGNYTHFVSIQRNITERKRTEESLRESQSLIQQVLEREKEARAEAESANRAKDDFVAMVSHDLRSPLNAILGWTQLMRMRKQDEPTIARALETIERNAKAQNQLLEDLLDVSRMIRGQLEIQMCQVELIPMINTAITAVQLAAQKKTIRLECHLDTTIEHISADPNRLQQIIGNLLTNALKFTPEGGTITVCLERVETYAQITVSDTGKGISAEFLPYIFQRFRQGNVTTRQGGLGLGLAIARHLVELHGGTIQAKSPGEGKGSTFTIKLPLLVGVQEKKLNSLLLNPISP